MKLKDNDQIVDALHHDSSICCKHKRQRITDIKKRSYKEANTTSESETDDSFSGTPATTTEQKRKTKKLKVKPTNAKPAAKPTISTATSTATSSSASTSASASASASTLPATLTSKLDELVCTPDLFNFLNESLQTTMRTGPAPSTSKQNQSASKSVSAAQSAQKNDSYNILTTNVNSLTHGPNGPPPLVIRNVQGGHQPRPGHPQQASRQAIATKKVSYVPPRPQPQSQTVNQVVTTPISGASPIYHTINGYRIDLNSAAQQTTYRLPNGKIIQVKKQAPVNVNPTQSNSTAQQRSRQAANYKSILQQVQQQQQPQSLQQQLQQPPQRMQPRLVRPVQSRPGQARNQPAQRYAGPNLRLPGHGHGIAYTPQQMSQMIQRGVNPNQYIVQQPSGANAQPHILNGMPPLAHQLRKYADTPVGHAQRQLEQQIIGGQDICHHIINKMNILMNSNAYKTAKSMNEIKELHIHLSYLLTYTIGRFQSMQEKCLEDMRKMGFSNDAESLLSGQVIDKYGSDCEEDELAIVEPQHATIAIDDSDDEDAANKTKTTPVKSTAAVLKVAKTEAPDVPEEAEEGANDIDEPNQAISDSENDDMPLDISALLETQVIVAADEDKQNSDDVAMVDDLEIPMPPPLTLITAKAPAIQIELNDKNGPQIKDSPDGKLKTKPMQIVLKRCEVDFPVVKKILLDLSSSSENDAEEEKNATASTSLNGKESDSIDVRKLIDDIITDKSNEIEEKQTKDDPIEIDLSNETEADSETEKTVEILEESTVEETPPNVEAKAKATEDTELIAADELDNRDIDLTSNAFNETDTQVDEEIQAISGEDKENITIDDSTPIDENVEKIVNELNSYATSHEANLSTDQAIVDDQNQLPDITDTSMEVTIADPGVLDPSILEPSLIEPMLLTEADQQILASTSGTTNGIVSMDFSETAELESISSPDTFDDYCKNGIDASRIDDKELSSTGDAFVDAINDLLRSSDDQFDMVDL